MPFTAGGTLAAGVPVQLSDGLREVPGWKPGKENVAGASEYVKEDGCVVRQRCGPTSQPSPSPGTTGRPRKRSSSTWMPAFFPPTWNRRPCAGAGNPAGPPAVEVLVFKGGERSGTRATAIYARLFSKSGSSVYLSVSCPDAAALAAARSEAEARIAVVPPSAWSAVCVRGRESVIKQ